MIVKILTHMHKVVKMIVKILTHVHKVVNTYWCWHIYKGGEV
jgi:hypothetical protein